MANYTAALNRARAKAQKKLKKAAKQSQGQARADSEITSAEWLMILSIAIIGDLLGPAGLPFGIIIFIWYIMKFDRLPIEKIIGVVLGVGLIETLSGGILPGLTGFVVWTYLEQKGWFRAIMRIVRLAVLKK